MANKFSEWLISTDMYGKPITVNYHGSAVFHTKLGAFVSLVTYCLMLFNLVILIEGFIDASKQNESQ